MKPSITYHQQGELFRSRISDSINPKHPLKILAESMNWAQLEDEFGVHYKPSFGQPPKPIRLMVGLLLLEHIHKLSDEQVVARWMENIYWQYFCGYDYMAWEESINPSSLTRFRQRIGEGGMKKILQYSVQAAINQGVIHPKDTKKVVADTTVMEKNIAYPTDTELLNKLRIQLVKLSKKHGIKLRQTYARLGKYKVLKASRYAHAKQFKRMRKCVKTLKTYLGRVVRDIRRKIISDEQFLLFKRNFYLADRLLKQAKTSKDKIYSIHEPHVYCVSKGKARCPYQYGSKVSVIATQKKGIVLSSDALAFNMYDGHTLKGSLKIAEKITETKISRVLVDKGYKGHQVENRSVYMSGQRRGISKYMKRELKKRSSIEAHISHMKNDGKLSRNFLKGMIGDKINAVLCAIGHNFRSVLSHIKNSVRQFRLAKLRL